MFPHLKQLPGNFTRVERSERSPAEYVRALGLLFPDGMEEELRHVIESPTGVCVRLLVGRFQAVDTEIFSKRWELDVRD